MNYEIYKNTDLESLVIILALSLVITVAAYLFVPSIILLTGKKYNEKKIRKIVTINGIVWCILFFLIESAQGEAKINIAPCVLWSSVAYAVLKKYCLVDETPEYDSPKSLVDVEVANCPPTVQNINLSVYDTVKELSENCTKAMIQINRNCIELEIPISDRKLTIATFSLFFARWVCATKNISYAQIEETKKLYKNEFSEFNKVAFQDDSYSSVIENERLFSEALERFIHNAQVYYDSNTNSFRKEMLEFFILEFVYDSSNLEKIIQFIK